MSGSGKPRRRRGGKAAKLSWASVLGAVLLFAVWFISEREGIVTPAPAPAPRPEGTASVHYIDVGQGDCELIMTPEGNVLIDAGEYEYADKVSEYLRAQGVSKIDVLVATHPHSDHIGGMAEIIGDFEIGSVLMPRAENTSSTYERMLTAMAERGLKARAPAVGERFSLGGAEFTVLAPSAEEYDNLNNYSIALRMVYGGHSFMFTADAEGMAEREILATGLEVSADFLSVGHHGSTTSSTREFLEAVAPKIAVISSAMGNDYGHPHEETLDKLGEIGAEIYRTDRSGTIVVETDGERYKIITEK